MLKMFCPDFRFTRISEIPVVWLQEQGIRRVILDADNTLLPKDKELPDTDSLAWIESLRQEEIEVVVLSNNGGKRLRSISEYAGLEVVSWGVKPIPWGFKRAVKRFKERHGRVLVIGDQLLTDILGAKLMGFKGLWVRSLTGKEFLGTRLSRMIEKILVRKLEQQGLLPEEIK